MFNKKEILPIASIILVLTIIISISGETFTGKIFLIALAMVAITILGNILVKKATSYYLDTEMEISTWEFKRFGYKKHQHFKRPILIGIFLPLILKFLSLGFVNWMACLTFEVKGKIYRAARRHGIYSYSEITEEEIGLIAGIGIIATLLFALIGYLIGFPEFAKINLAFAFFNLIPISNLDGAKIFFGGKIFWTVLSIITVIAGIATIIAI